MAEATPDTERAVEDHMEMWNEREYASVSDVVSDSYVESNPVAPGGEIRGPDGLEEWMREITAAFPDIEGEILDLLAADETAMAELQFSMTHEGEFGELPPTGRAVEFRAMATFLVEDGEITELRNYFDSQALFEQLGVADEERREAE